MICADPPSSELHLVGVLVGAEREARLEVALLVLGERLGDRLVHLLLLGLLLGADLLLLRALLEELRLGLLLALLRLLALTGEELVADLLGGLGVDLELEARRDAKALVDALQRHAV